MHPPLIDSIDLDEVVSGPVDRYFTKLYSLEDDICFMFHTNKVCVITLAPHHALMRGGRSVTKVDFRINERTDRRQNQVSGKGKKGAQILEEKARLCILHDSTGETHVLRSGIKGKLIEVNERFDAEPNLVVSRAEGEGYIAIAMPVHLGSDLTDKGRLVSWEKYDEARRCDIKAVT